MKIKAFNIQDIFQTISKVYYLQTKSSYYILNNFNFYLNKYKGNKPIFNF